MVFKGLNKSFGRGTFLEPNVQDSRYPPLQFLSACKSTALLWEPFWKLVDYINRHAYTKTSWLASHKLTRRSVIYMQLFCFDILFCFVSMPFYPHWSISWNELSSWYYKLSLLSFSPVALDKRYVSFMSSNFTNAISMVLFRMNTTPHFVQFK